jgi:hypothetical protein
MPWDAIAKVLVAALVLVGGFFGVRRMGSERSKRKQVEASLDAYKKAEEITNEPLPTDDDDIRKLLRDR